MMDEVHQDELWDALEASQKKEEERSSSTGKERSERESKEWKESERHLLKVEDLKKTIGQRAKEQGSNPGRCDKDWNCLRFWTFD